MLESMILRLLGVCSEIYCVATILSVLRDLHRETELNENTGGPEVSINC